MCGVLAVIVDLLLAIVGGIISGLTGLLPEFDLPMWSQVMSFADDASRFLFMFDGLLPVADYVSVMRAIATIWLPGWMVFRVVKFAVAHIPVLNIGGS